MILRLCLFSSLFMLCSTAANADDRYGPRIRFGRVEFGIPIYDAFVTVHGEETTVKVFSRGDIANVHTESGTQVDLGIRSLLVPRRPQHTPEADADAEALKLQVSEPGAGALAENSSVDVDRRSSAAVESPSDTPLDEAARANTRGNYRTAERIATKVLAKSKNDHRAYSIRATSFIGQGEEEQDVELIRQGLSDINRALKLGKRNGDESKRDYLIWMIGMNQSAAMESDTRRARRTAKMVEEFTMNHVDKFSAEFQEKVYHQQGVARLLLGKRKEAAESFAKAGKFGERIEIR